MRPYVTFAIATLLVFAKTGCNQTPSVGVYVSESREKDYLELKPNGSFFLKEKRNQVAGKYELEDGGVTLIFERGIALRAAFKKDTLIDQDGDKWILWRGGTSGFEYEEAWSKVNRKTQELWRQVSEGSLSQREAEEKRIVLLLEMALISPGKADEERQAIEQRSLPSSPR